MKPEAQRIAIAEYCEWTKIECTGPFKSWIGSRRPGFYGDLPDYLNDINAMHDAEEQAGLNIIKAMRFHLWEICDQMTAHHATAAQRAEAFLRAVGKWVD